MNWPALLDSTDGSAYRFMCARGKNIQFINIMTDAFGLESKSPPKDLSEFKRACTPDVVVRLHRAVLALWPDAGDLERTLELEREKQSGLYIGDYHPEAIRAGITRHSLYHETVLLVDPFIYPTGVKPEFNPLVHPDQFLTTTLRNVQLWLSLASWIDEGLVRFVRTMQDFDPEVRLQCFKTEEQRYASNAELGKLVDEQAADLVERRGRENAEYMSLIVPDEALRKKARRLYPNLTVEEMEKVIAHIHERRRQHPFLIPTERGDGPARSEFLVETTGANYEMGKITAAQTGSYLMTDLPARWREMELDREAMGLGGGDWEPFTKAFSAVPMRFLEDVTLADALRLRREERLADMRAFLRKVWKAAATGEPFSPTNVRHLTDQLQYEVNQAEKEWEEIDTNLIAPLGTGLVAAGAAIVTGQAALAVCFGLATCVTSVGMSKRRRERLLDKYPAGFFLGIRQRSA